MRRLPVALLAIALVVGAPLLDAGARAASPSGAPAQLVTLTGDGVGTYPAFDPSVTRYAVTTSAETGGTVTVHAATSDPQGTVTVDGRPAPDGRRTVTGLEPGDEISVVITDAGGTAARSFIYLPDEFPLLERTTPPDARATDGTVLLTLGKWVSPGPFFETAVDQNGVPVYVHQSFNSMDLHPQPGGHYSVARGGANGADIVELDEQFREVRRMRTVGLVHTDGHDAILNPDGSAYLMAYEPDRATGLTDAVIQHVSATGDVLFEWNSADHVDVAAETVVPAANRDYAHINSFEVMDDGDLLVSFRHLSAVLKIARHAHDGFAEGDVVWRLGGRASDFTFTDTTGAPDGGPCAQHTATQLPNGDIMVFDNGAWNLDPMCIDPADPSGPLVARTPTRIAQWSLDETSMTATMVKDVMVGGRYAIFAGSAQSLAGGNTLVGWASATQAVASELAPSGDVVWEVVAPESPKYFTYRAFKVEVPDAIAPDAGFVSPTVPVVVAAGATEVPEVTCTDRGGSNLQSCDVIGFDTATPGTRTMTVVATDGAGNRTTASRAYVVTATPPAPSPTPPAPVPPAPGAVRHLPDLHVKVQGRGWHGRDSYDVRRGQTARVTTDASRAVYRVRLQNDGTVADRFVVRLHTRAVVSAPRWITDGRRSPRLAPGESVTVRLVVRRGGAVARTRIVARPAGDHDVRDRIWTLTTWR